MKHSALKIRILHRCIVALAALATLAAPASWHLHARADREGRTLLLSVCTSAGVPIRTEVPLPGRDPAGACQQCALCVAGADRPVAGPLPAGIPVPASLAEEEQPAARPRSRPASDPVRVARARDPPALS